MRSRPLVVLMAVTPLALVVGCNAITGVDDFAFGRVGQEGGMSSEDGGDPNGEGGTGGDATVIDDGGGVIDPNIPVVKPSLTNCGTDSICLSNSSGWTPALYPQFAISRTCPTNWPTAVIAKMSGGGSCACNCTPSPASACTGSLETRTGPANMCTSSPTTLPIATDGKCTLMPEAGLPTPVSITSTGVVPTSCGAAVESQLGDPDTVTTCTGATPSTSGACEGSELCLPQAPKMFGIPTGSLCIAHDGLAACPDNLPVRLVTGASVKDGRSCGTTCACAPSDCKGGSVDTFNAADCTSPQRSFATDGTCIASGTTTALSYQYTRSDGCKVTTKAQTMGTETYQSPRTYCCLEIF